MPPTWAVPGLFFFVTLTQTRWTKEKTGMQDEFIWGIVPEALSQMTRAEYKTEPDKMLPHNSYRKETHDTIKTNSSGQDTRKAKHQKTSGGDL